MRKAYFFTLLFLAATGNLFGQFAGGTGTETDPFQIATAEHLDSVRNYIDGFYFIQTNDIDLNGESWIPIGGGVTSQRFTGHFDGGGFRILNLSINLPGDNDVGLFGLYGPPESDNELSVSIKNLGLINANVIGGTNTGALVGRVSGGENTTIEKCYVIGGSVTGDGKTGGLVGANNTSSSNPATIRRPKIHESFSNIHVIFSGSGSDPTKFGGLVGCNTSGDIFNSYSGSTLEIFSSSASAIGGLVGCMINNGIIENTYFNGYLEVNTSASLVGGLIGNREGSSAFVNSSYWDIETSGTLISAGGSGRNTAQMLTQANYTGWDFGTNGIWNIIENETYPYLRNLDLGSGFNVELEDDSQKLIAGEPFNLIISDAKDFGGVILDGVFSVSVSTNIPEESFGDEQGVVWQQIVNFNDGSGILQNVILGSATDHVITVNVETIPENEDLLLTIHPTIAIRLAIEVEPDTPVTGTFDDEPAIFSPAFTIITQDQYGNPTDSTLSTNVQVNVALIVNPEDAQLTGDTQQNFTENGNAIFNGLGIDKEGQGFIIEFSSDGLESVAFGPFDVTGISNLSEFDVTADSPQYENIEFPVFITNAINPAGELMNGNVLVNVTSAQQTGNILNQEINFTEGHATFNIALSEIAQHELTVTINGVSENIIIEVLEDQSGFTIVDPGQQFSGFAFNLQITNATLVNGSDLEGETEVAVTSSTADGLVFSGPVIFSNGEAFIPLILNELGNHDLTVSINGITNDETIEDVNVAENVSGFDVAEITDAQTAGVEFNLDITDARNTSNGLLNGSFTVNVTSNIAGELNEGVVFNEEVSFLEGAATFGVTLTKAADPNQITIAIETILPTETLDIEVIAAAASQLVITQQPTGGSGTNNNQPVNVGTVILETQDAFGNPSIVGLSGTENITASISNDASEFEDANLGGDLTKDISSGMATFDNLTINKEGEGYTLVFTAVNESLGFIETDEFDISNINDLRSFDIVDPGPQVIGVNFEVNIINATNSDGSLRNGSYNILVGDFAAFMVLYNLDTNFTDGAASIFTTLPYNALGERNTLFRLDNDENSQQFLTVLVVDSDNSNLSLELVPNEDPSAGDPFEVLITAQDKAGNPLNGPHFISFATDNEDEGNDGLLFEGVVQFEDGDYTFEDITLFRAGLQNLSVETPWVTNPGTLEINVLPNVVDRLVITEQILGATGNNDDEPVNIGTVTIQTFDAYGNPSIVNLTGTQELTVRLGNDPSGGAATLEPSTGLVKDILSGTVTFDELTLDRDGIGYTLVFEYSGDPDLELAQAETEPFDIVSINSYSITVQDSDNNELGGEVALEFETVIAGYDPSPSETVTVLRTGSGFITNLSVDISGPDADNFNIGELTATTLNDDVNSAEFTVSPIMGLVAGTYGATLVVSADNGINESFDVIFVVLEPYAISIQPEDEIDFGLYVESYGNVPPAEVTITNVGGNPIENLTVTLVEGSESDFEISGPGSDFLESLGVFTTFEVNPKNGLEIGSYSEMIMIVADNIDPVYINVLFQVIGEAIWTGTINSNWHNSGNWSTESYPDHNVHIRIQPSPNNPSISQANVEVGSMVIEDGSTLTVNSNRSLVIRNNGKLVINPAGRFTVNGNLVNNAGNNGLLLESNANSTASLILFNAGVEATVERYLYGTHANFQHITSTSVAGQSFESFFADNHGVLGYFEPIYAMREYDEGSGWTPYFNENKEGELQVGTAYIIGPSQPGKLTFKGEIRHNNLTKGLTHTTFGWNGIGNPFTAPIDISSFFDTNLDGFFEGFQALYIYDPANAPGYQTVNNTTKEIGGLSEIAIGQGFIVKAREEGASFSFTTGMRKHAETQFFKDQDIRSNWYSMKLKVSDYSRNMTTLIAFNKNMTMGLDATYDAGQFQTSSTFNLFTRTPEELSELNLSIQALPDFGLEDVYIPVGFKYPQGGEVIFSAESMNLPEHFEARLYDSQEDIYINLSEENYTVVLAANSEPVGRFFLLMKSQIMHLVNYDALNDGGDITASVNGETIDTGSMVSDGSSVSFFAIAHNGYEIEHWLIDGVILDGVTESEIIIEELLEDLHVQVSFKETSTQIDESFADDNLIIYIFENQLIISGEVGENARAILYDMLGRQMRVESLQPGEFNSFSVEGLKPGAYVILIQENDRQSSRKLLLDY